MAATGLVITTTSLNPNEPNRFILMTVLDTVDQTLIPTIYEVRFDRQDIQGTFKADANTGSLGEKEKGWLLVLAESVLPPWSE